MRRIGRFRGQIGRLFVAGEAEREREAYAGGVVAARRIRRTCWWTTLLAASPVPATAPQ